jgi:hypothetical protein
MIHRKCRELPETSLQEEEERRTGLPQLHRIPVAIDRALPTGRNSPKTRSQGAIQRED